MVILLALLLLAHPVAAFAGVEETEAYLESKKDAANRARIKTTLLAECLDAHSEDLKWYLAELRKDFTIPPFSQAWCIGQKHTSQEFREGGEKH